MYNDDYYSTQVFEFRRFKKILFIAAVKKKRNLKRGWMIMRSQKITTGLHQP